LLQAGPPLVVFFWEGYEIQRNVSGNWRARENYDLLFADFIDQPVMFNEKFPYSRIADLRNSPSPFGKSPQRAGGESG